MVSARQFHVHNMDRPCDSPGAGGAGTLVMLVLDDDDDADEGSSDHPQGASSTCLGALHGHITTHAPNNASAGAGQAFPRAPSKRARQHPPPLVHAVGHCALADGQDGCSESRAGGDAARSAAGHPVSCVEAPCVESQGWMPTRLPAETGASVNESSPRCCRVITQPSQSILPVCRPHCRP